MTGHSDLGATRRQEPTDASHPLPVSVVIPNYNSGDLLDRCVRSINGGTMPSEILIIDDQSTDGSLGLAKKLAAEFPNIRLIVKSTNTGATDTRMTGFLNASHDWISYVDADDYIDTQAVLNAYQAAIARDADICLWQMWSSGDHGQALNVDLAKITFPLSGKRAAELTLGDWRIHPLGVSKRSLYLDPLTSIKDSWHCSDELVSRVALSRARSVCACDSKYFYCWTDQPTASTKMSANRVTMLDSQLWLNSFARDFTPEAQLQTLLTSIDQGWSIRGLRRELGRGRVHIKLASFALTLLVRYRAGLRLLRHPSHLIRLGLLFVPVGDNRIYSGLKRHGGSVVKPPQPQCPELDHRRG